MKRNVVIGFFLIIILIVFVYIGFPTAIKFTEEELKWMDEHPVIYVAPDPTFGPVEFITEDGQFKGLSMDYLDWIEEHTPIQFEIVSYENWSEIVIAIKNKEIDMLSAAVITDERKEYLIFSNPFYKIKNVILTRTEFKGRITFDDLIGESVIVLKDYAIEDYLTATYPEVNLIQVNLVEEGIALLSLGTYDYMSASLAQISYYLDKNNTTNLKVSGDVDLDQDLRFAVRDDYLPLPGILNKALEAMDKKTKDDIYNKWINVGLIKGVSTELFYTVLLITGVILFAVLIVTVFNRTLRRKVDQKTNALNSELEQRKKVERELAYLNDTLEHKVNLRTCELERALENLSMIKDELVESEKMVALGKITLNMAHNLNTPIGSAITMNSYIYDLSNKLDSSDFSDACKKIIKDIHKSSEMVHSELDSAKKYIDQMKSVSNFKIDAPKQIVNLKGYLLLLANTYNDLFKKHGIEIHLICDEKITLFTSTTALDCIFKNLIDNSLSHGFKSYKGNIQINVQKFDKQVVIDYRDDGQGISDDIVNDIFSPMFTTNMASSKGMGLNMLYNTVKFDLHGTLKVDNHLEKGVAFIITIELNE